MFTWEMRSYRGAKALLGQTIFDRCRSDLMIIWAPVPDSIVQAAQMRRYATRVFLVPHWPAIFTQDTERKQTVAEAEATHHAMVEAYGELEYELVSLPIGTVTERARFIRSRIGR